MNLLLFENSNQRQTLNPEDPRLNHIRKVLKFGAGDTIDVGALNGPRGKATIVEDGPKGMSLQIEWGEVPPPPFPIDLIIGLPRPQAARKILRESTSLGVAAISFFHSDKSEHSYADSKLWNSREWRRHLLNGAEQAFTTHIPDVRHFDSLGAAIEHLDNDRAPEQRLALDLYESTIALPAVKLTAQRCTLALGADRGWSAAERQILRAAGFILVHLGERVLRTETACVAAVSLVVAGMALMKTWQPAAPSNNSRI